MRHLIITAFLLTLSAPVLAQSIGVATQQLCTVSAGVVACVPQPGTSTILIAASNGALADLQDSLAPAIWDGSELTCNECTVVRGFPGCSAVGDRVVATERQAAMAQLYCVLRSHILQKLKRERDEAQLPVEEPVIGGGDPGE